jgi:RNA polymerase sigma factor (sigma-70 family)
VKNNLGHLSDEELLAAFKTSDDNIYFGELYTRYRHLILGVCLNYLKKVEDSEDAVMEIVEKLHLDIKKNEIVQWKGWLYMVARNHCLMKIRKAGLKVQYLDQIPESKSNDSDMEDDQCKELLLQALESKLNLLKPNQKTCLTLFYLDEKSYKQIAQETNFTINDIKSHIQNGKLNLKKMLLKIDNA